MFYLRECSLLHKFKVFRKKVDKVDSKGRHTSSYEEGIEFWAILTSETTNEKEQNNQLSHPISHTITHRGNPVANECDMLVLGDRKFYIQGVENPGTLNLWTIYNVEERFDYNTNEVGDNNVSKS